MANIKEESRGSWNGDRTFDSINAGSLQRIADATEVMAKNHAQLISDCDRFEQMYSKERQRRGTLEHQVRALKGVITKLRKELEQIEHARSMP